VEERAQILVVDSASDRLMSTSKAIRSAGFEPLGAETGADAMQAAKSHHPAIILVDAALTDISGIDLIKQIKLDPDLAASYVVFCASERTSSAFEGRALDSGADCSIPRDVPSRELAARLQAVMRRRQAEYALRHNLQRMTAAFHACPDPVYLVDNALHISDCNLALSKLLGKPPSEIIGRGYLEMVLGSKHPIADDRYQGVLQERRTESLDVSVRGRVMRMTIAPLIDDQDRLTGTIHILTDLTELHRAQQEAGERLERMQRELDEANALMERTGEQLSEEADARKQAEEALSQAHDKLLDLQEQLETAEARVEEMTEELEEMSEDSVTSRLEAVRRLAGGSARQFNEVIAGVLGAAEVGLSQLEPDYPAYEEMTAVQRAARRAGELTRRLANIHRPILAAPGPVDLNQLITDQHKVLRRLAGEAVDLQLDLAPDLQPVHGRADLLEHALLNLVEHGREAMPEGGVLYVATEAPVAEVLSDEEERQEAQPEQAYIRLTISDTGPGLDTDALDHLFEPFYFDEDDTQLNPLGLAEVFGIVRQHDGWIEVDSEEGMGTRFDLFLPLHQEQ